jgi:hypothetical protein
VQNKWPGKDEKPGPIIMELVGFSNAGDGDTEEL